MDATTLAAAMLIPVGRAQIWAAALTSAMDRFGISSPRQQAAFLATINHESRGLEALEENLNYSTEGLLKTWRKRFRLPAELESRETRVFADGMGNALWFHRRPQEIANFAYGGRYGNAPDPGAGGQSDGWYFRGRGPLQLTFRDNYRRCSSMIGIDIELAPDLVTLDVNVGARAAAEHFANCGAHLAAETGNFDAVSDLVNQGRITAQFGDAIGFKDRLAKLKTAEGVLLS